MILLDTCAWLWWMSDPDQLSGRARREIDAAVRGGGVLISAISAWEIGIKEAKGKLRLRWPAEEFVARSAALPVVKFIPLSPEVAVASSKLAMHHQDPADRFIIATALRMRLPVATSDGKFGAYDGLAVVW